MLNIPDSALEFLSDRQNILLIGAGGAFDILATMPVYYSLINQFDVKVHLANYSFVHFSDIDSLIETVDFEPNIKGTTGNIKSYTNHFPEAYISSYFKEGVGSDVPVWLFNSKQTTKELAKSYQRFFKHMQIDAVIACGFGLRSIMQGNEQNCGNMIHTTMNLGALSIQEEVPKILFTIGHESMPQKGVSFNSALENISALNKQGAYLGGLMMDKHSSSYSFMKSVFEWIITQPEHETNELAESVFIGIEGGFGPHDKSQALVTPLMAMCHFFEMETVLSMNKVFSLIRDSEDYASTIQDGMSLINNSNQREHYFLEI